MNKINQYSTPTMLIKYFSNHIKILNVPIVYYNNHNIILYIGTLGINQNM